MLHTKLFFGNYVSLRLFNHYKKGYFLQISGANFLTSSLMFNQFCYSCVDILPETT